MNTEEKYRKLRVILQDMKQAVVAYSGGVDSTFLLKVATDVLGENAFGVLAISPTYPSREYDVAIEQAGKMGVRIEIIETQETEEQRFLENPVNRCYFCKSELYEKIAAIAGERQYKNMIDGSNADDQKDYRPGMAALKEKGVRSPLQEAGLGKAEIRELSKILGLQTWNKEALACLSSRFPYGEKIDLEKLRMVDEIENYLHDLGFRNIRARHQKKTLKIEVNPQDIRQFFDEDIRIEIVRRAREIGYTSITVDLEGYRQGSMNEALGPKINADELPYQRS